MANEMESLLVAQLKVTIEEVVKETVENLPAKLFSLPSKLEYLKRFLEQGTFATSIYRVERFKDLNNVLRWWKQQSNKQAPYSFGSFFACKKFSMQLDKITRSLNNMRSDSSDHGSSSDEGTEAFRLRDGYFDETTVHGLSDKAMSLQKLLISPTDDGDRVFNMIGIAGMFGIGKTTLTQLVFNRPQVKNHFLRLIWVCMPKKPLEDPDYRKEIVKRMLKSLEVEDRVIDSANKIHGLKGLLSALRLHLEGKRYLVVLDNVSNTEEQCRDFCSSLDQDYKESCEKLAYGLPKGFGGTVIVTSRSDELVMEMVGKKNLHRLRPPSDPESYWKIFRDTVGQTDEPLEGLKSDIIDKCAGLPLAAKAMGNIVRKQLATKSEAPQISEHQEIK